MRVGVFVRIPGGLGQKRGIFREVLSEVGEALWARGPPAMNTKEVSTGAVLKARHVEWVSHV